LCRTPIFSFDPAMGCRSGKVGEEGAGAATPQSRLSVALALSVAAATLAAGSGLLAKPDQSDLRTTEAPPQRHELIEHPRSLSPQRAEEIYRAIRSNLQAAYALSGDIATKEYAAWRRFNSHPYRSATHGELFVNNYGNDLARSYGEYENGGAMPAGAIIVKDSFIMTTEGDIQTGPFALMEKMPTGFDPVNGDWRYMLIDSRGEVQGISGGYGSERVAFCGACHRTAAPATDHLFFMPKAFRK
jgi:hypothetical protein